MSSQKILPTKLELIRLRRSVVVAKKIHKILDDKREVLLKKLNEYMDEAAKASKSLNVSVLKGYDFLYEAYLEMGSMRLEATAKAAPPAAEVTVNVKRIVDVDVPSLTLNFKEVLRPYGFEDTSYSLDQAYSYLSSLLPGILKAAEMENVIFRLVSEIERTQRTLNALEFIIIPQYESQIRFIASTLEERDREEFVRLKSVKRVLERRRVPA
ncbi:MAG TPA: V-type ATP synthase subunit D [Conexivisphaerales archaeon]|nr:V-type ATP synthase subunit D [Conexivisphaerales archaeon]